MGLADGPLGLDGLCRRPPRHRPLFFFLPFTYSLVLYLYLFISINYFNMVIFFSWTGSYLRIAVSTRPHVMTLGISPSQVHVERKCVSVIACVLILSLTYFGTKFVQLFLAFHSSEWGSVESLPCRPRIIYPP